MASYQALYRQWRPKTFREVVGQEHVVHTLKSALLHHRLVHAYLFCGPRGTGKTSIARILAKALNCLHPQEGEPCTSCLNCQRIDEGSSLDVFEMDAASHRGIDEIRYLIDKIPLSPVEGKYKVYIVDEVHMLTTEAFNALLKTLEEPPPHALFILATTEPRKVPPTILSRCQRFDFRLLTPEQIKARLNQVAEAEGFSLEASALNLLARKARGSLRDGLSLLDQVLTASAHPHIREEQVALLIGTPPGEDMVKIFSLLADGDALNLFYTLEKILSRGVDPKSLVEDLVAWGRHLLFLSLDPSFDTGELGAEGEKLKKLAPRFSPQRILGLLERLQQVEVNLRWHEEPRFLLEVALGDFLLSSPPWEEFQRRLAVLERRVEALERKGVGGGDKLQALQTTGSPSEGQLREKWAQVLKIARQKSIQLQAYLREGIPIALGGDRLVVEVKADFHRGMLEQPHNRQQVERILERVWGYPLKLQVVANREEMEKEGIGPATEIED